MNKEDQAEQKILRRREVERLTGLPRSSMYAYIAAGKFPRAVRLSERTVGWLSSEIDEWIAAAAARRGAK